MSCYDILLGGSGMLHLQGKEQGCGWSWAFIGHSVGLRITFYYALPICVSDIIWHDLMGLAYSRGMQFSFFVFGCHHLPKKKKREKNNNFKHN